MKINFLESQKMFKRSGVSRAKLFKALTEMAPIHLKGALKKQWSSDNPTRNFCYVVTEWLKVYVAPEGSTAYSVPIDGDLEKHYFMRWPNGGVVDLTAEQFEDYSKVDYTKGKKVNSFMFSPTKRVKALQELMK